MALTADLKIFSIQFWKVDPHDEPDYGPRKRLQNIKAVTLEEALKQLPEGSTNPKMLQSNTYYGW